VNSIHPLGSYFQGRNLKQVRSLEDFQHSSTGRRLHGGQVCPFLILDKNDSEESALLPLSEITGPGLEDSVPRPSLVTIKSRITAYWEVALQLKILFTIPDMGIRLRDYTLILESRPVIVGVTSPNEEFQFLGQIRLPLYCQACFGYREGVSNKKRKETTRQGFDLDSEEIRLLGDYRVQSL
jgi:hypothetical protein